jgi:superkiller protein 3
MSAEQYFNEGVTLSNQGKKAEALQAYDKAIQLNPYYVLAYCNKGNVLNSLGMREEAIQAYDKALQLKPDAMTYFNKGIVLKALGKKEEALQAYDKAIQLNPDYALAYSSKGIILNDLGKKEEAIQAYDKAIQLKPDYAEAYNNKGAALNDLGKKEEALQAYDKVIQLKPDYASAYYNKGTVLDDLGKKEEAIKAYDKAIQLKPDYPSAYYNKGTVLTVLGKREEAIQAYDKAIQLRPDYADAYYNKGILLKALGKKEEAIQVYNKAIQISSNNPLYFCARGQVLRQLGKEKEALEDLNQAYGLVQKGVFGNHASSGHVNYINHTLNKDRKELIQKLTTLGNELDSLEQTTYTLKDQEQATKVIDKLKQLKQNYNKISEQAFNKLNTETLDTSPSTETSSIMQRFEALENEMKELRQQAQENTKQIKKMDQVLQDASVYDAAQIKKDVDTLRQDPKLYDYYKTFYWTLSNYVSAYRSLSSGLINGNTDFDESEKESLIVKGLQKVVSWGTKLAEGVPFVGGIISGIDSIIDDAYSMRKERILQNKINVITQFVIDNNDTDDELSLKLAKTAIEITKAKKEAILNPEKLEKSEMKIVKGLKWIANKIEALIEDAKNKFASVAELYNSEEKKLALQDVTLLLGYLYNNSKKIIIGVELHCQLRDIVIKGGIDEVLARCGTDSAPTHNDEVNVKLKSKKSKNSCCNIFAVYDIQYDNPLINFIYHNGARRTEGELFTNKFKLENSDSQDYQAVWLVILVLLCAYKGHDNQTKP